MTMLLSRTAWAKFPVFRNGLFLAQKVFISAFLVQIRNQRLKIDPCGKFQPDWTKDKGNWNFDLKRYRRLLDDVGKITTDFEKFCSMPSLVVIGPQIKEKQRGREPQPIFYRLE